MVTSATQSRARTTKSKAHTARSGANGDKAPKGKQKGKVNGKANGKANGNANKAKTSAKTARANSSKASNAKASNAKTNMKIAKASTSRASDAKASRTAAGSAPQTAPSSYGALSLEMPAPIAAAGLAGKPVSHRWGRDISNDIMYGDAPQRLAKAVESITEGAAIGLMMAVAEWVAWRFHGIVDITDPLLRLEAGYACCVDHQRADLPEPDEPFPKEHTNCHGPLMLAKLMISDLYKDLAGGMPDTANGWATNMIQLARHVAPPARKAFDAWLEDTLRRTHELCPDANPPEGIVLPRSFFFDASKRWDRDTLAAAVDEYLAGLNPASNRYLRATT
jgi:hypothetical protein